MDPSSDAVTLPLFATSELKYGHKLCVQKVVMEVALLRLLTMILRSCFPQIHYHLPPSVQNTSSQLAPSSKNSLQVVVGQTQKAAAFVGHAR